MSDLNIVKCTLIWATALTLIVCTLIISIQQYNLQTDLAFFREGYCTQPILGSNQVLYLKCDRLK